MKQFQCDIGVGPTYRSRPPSKISVVHLKTTSLRIELKLDGAPIMSKSHNHPSHSETSRLLTSSLSLGIPVPRATQCMGGM